MSNRFTSCIFVAATALSATFANAQSLTSHRGDLTCREESDHFADAVGAVLSGGGDVREAQRAGQDLNACVRDTLQVLTPQPQFVPANNTGPALFWYQNGLQLTGANQVAAGIATGQWGYWGIYGAQTPMPVRAGAAAVRPNCQSNEVATGIPANNLQLYCTQLQPRFYTANIQTFSGVWNMNIRYSCPAGKALVGWNFQSQQNFTFNCADIMARPY